MNLIFCITFCFRFRKDLLIELNSITNRGMHIYNFTYLRARNTIATPRDRGIINIVSGSYCRELVSFIWLSTWNIESGIVVGVMKFDVNAPTNY